MIKENLKTKKLARKLFKWAENADEWDFKDIHQSLKDVEYAYTCSNYSDDTQSRREVAFNISLLHKLLETLQKFKPEHFSNLNDIQLIIEQKEAV